MPLGAPNYSVGWPFPQQESLTRLRHVGAPFVRWTLYLFLLPLTINTHHIPMILHSQDDLSAVVPRPSRPVRACRSRSKRTIDVNSSGDEMSGQDAEDAVDVEFTSWRSPTRQPKKRRRTEKATHSTTPLRRHYPVQSSLVVVLPSQEDEAPHAPAPGEATTIPRAPHIKDVHELVAMVAVHFETRGDLVSLSAMARTCKGWYLLLAPRLWRTVETPERMYLQHGIGLDPWVARFYQSMGVVFKRTGPPGRSHVDEQLPLVSYIRRFTSKYDVGRDQGNVLSWPARMVGLRELTLHHYPRMRDTQLFKAVRGLTHLTLLDLTDCRNITDLPIVRLVQVLPNLMTLRLGDCANLTSRVLYFIARYAKLEELDLSRCRLITNDAITFFLESFRPQFRGIAEEVWPQDTAPKCDELTIIAFRDAIRLRLADALATAATDHGPGVPRRLRVFTPPSHECLTSEVLDSDAVVRSQLETLHVQYADRIYDEHHTGVRRLVCGSASLPDMALRKLVLQIVGYSPLARADAALPAHLSDYRFFSRMPLLSSLDVPWHCVDASLAKALSGVDRDGRVCHDGLPHLRTLTLRHCRTVDAVAVVRVVQGCRALRQVKVDNVVDRVLLSFCGAQPVNTYQSAVPLALRTAELAQVLRVFGRVRDPQLFPREQTYTWTRNLSDSSLWAAYPEEMRPSALETMTPRPLAFVTHYVQVAATCT